jgi:hypothetical protein
MGPWFFRFYPKDYPIQSPLPIHKGILKTYLVADIERAQGPHPFSPEIYDQILVKLKI